MRIGFPIVLEQMPFEPFERDGDEKSRRHDAVGIDVVASQCETATGECFNLHAGTPSSISRTSTTSPAIAAAATIAGLISSVRPVGLP